jgi:hypothetical protein
MELEVFTSVLTGSLGALAFLCVAVWALVNGVVHPNRAYQAQVDRVTLLQEENHHLNASIIELTNNNTELQVDLATLKAEVAYLRNQLEGLLREGRRV